MSPQAIRIHALRAALDLRTAGDNADRVIARATTFENYLSGRDKLETTMVVHSLTILPDQANPEKASAAAL